MVTTRAHTISRQHLTRCALVMAVLLSVLLSVAPRPASAAASSALFACNPSYIWYTAPIVTAPGGGFSNETVYWLPVIYVWDGYQWQFATVGKLAWANLYGGSSNLGWFDSEGNPIDQTFAYNLAPGYYLIENVVTYESGMVEKIYSQNYNYMTNPYGGEGETWCKSF